MAEDLTAADVATFTRGRLADDGGNGEVTLMLNAALTAARNYCGWHVSPVRTADVLTVDGPGGKKLFLRTLKIRSIVSIVENGQVVPEAQYVAAADTPGMVYRRQGCWTREYAGIVATITHGYIAAEAPDWRRAICQIVDQMSQQPITASGRSPSEQIGKRVDDVEYRWSDGRLQEQAARQVHSVSTILSNYRILPVV